MAVPAAMGRGALALRNGCASHRHRGSKGMIGWMAGFFRYTVPGAVLAMALGCQPPAVQDAPAQPAASRCWCWKIDLYPVRDQSGGIGHGLGSQRAQRAGVPRTNSLPCGAIETRFVMAMASAAA